MPPLRVLHLRDSPWVDGPGRTILETAAHVDGSRVEYHIAPLVSGAEGSNPLLMAARSRGLSAVPVRDPGGFPTALVDPIVEQVDRLGIQILHSSDFRTSLAALLVARRRSVRIVATAHGWIANTWRRRVVRLADKCLLRLFDRVIMVSGATRSLVPGWWLPDRKVRVIHNALVLGSYGREVLDRPRRSCDPRQAVTLVNVGRLSPEKGQSMLLEALAVLVPRWPGLRLRFAGVGPLEDDLRTRALRLGIADRVEFLGYIKDMPALYAECDLLVQSSFTEGLPNVVLEAAYLRLPMVATDVGGTREVVRHQHSAWLVEPTAESLRAGIEAFLDDPVAFRRMAETAHLDVVTNFSFEARTARQVSVYEELFA